MNTIYDVVEEMIHDDNTKRFWVVRVRNNLRIFWFMDRGAANGAADYMNLGAHHAEHPDDDL